MINLIDDWILCRVYYCIYQEYADFGKIYTHNEQELLKIKVIKISSDGKISSKFSVDKNLTIESHDGTNCQVIIDCFKQNGIHAN